MPDSKPHRRGAFANIPMPARLIIATRKSPLALAQAGIVARALEKFGVHCVLKKITATGDEITDRPLTDIGGKELFVGNLRRALLEGAADIAVHSLKDIPATLSDAFADVAVGFAEDPRDVFISQKYESPAETPRGATIGTCSPRRAALLREHFPHFRITEMRGNVRTRLQKMRDGACDGIILAAAGLRRLNLIPNSAAGEKYTSDEMHFSFLPPEMFIPAPGQGMLAAECAAARPQSADETAATIQKLRAALRDPKAELRRVAEGEFARRIGGDCRTPLGAFATIRADEICLRAFYAGGGHFRRAVLRRCADDSGARAVAAAAAEELLKQ